MEVAGDKAYRSVNYSKCVYVVKKVIVDRRREIAGRLAAKSM